RGTAGPDPAGRDRRRQAVHPASQRVRAGLDLRGGYAARRHSGAPGGQVQPGAARPADPLNRGLDRSRVLRARDARAVQRGDAADQAVAGHEDRAAVPVPYQLPRRTSVRLVYLRLQVPGPARAHAIAVVPELLPGEGLSLALATEMTKSRPLIGQMGDSSLCAKKIAAAYAGCPDSRQAANYRRARSKWPTFTAPRNVRQELPGYCTIGPVWSCESRTRTVPAAGAISTQAPLPALRLDVLHRRSPTSRIFGIIGLLQPSFAAAIKTRSAVLAGSCRGIRQADA